MVFVGSEKDISWLDEYTQIEGLKSQMNKNKILMDLLKARKLWNNLIENWFKFLGLEIIFTGTSWYWIALYIEPRFPAP